MTTLMVRDPFLASPLRLMDELLRSSGNGNRATGYTPVLDVRETPDEYLALVDLPGVKSENVTIEVNDQVLTISGLRVPVETGETQLVERPYGSFVRSLTLPKGVNSDEIKADYKDGVLTVVLPAREEAKPRQVQIAVN